MNTKTKHDIHQLGCFIADKLKTQFDIDTQWREVLAFNKYDLMPAIGTFVLYYNHVCAINHVQENEAINNSFARVNHAAKQKEPRARDWFILYLECGARAVWWFVKRAALVFGSLFLIMFIALNYGG
jgi:hypothetical protein